MKVFSKETFSQIKGTLVREVFSQRVRYPPLVFIAFLIILPLITTDPPLLLTFITANLMAVFAASWDLITGYTGQVSFGHCIFYGVAMYTAAMLNLYLDWQPLFTILLGALMATLVAFGIGVSCLRWRSEAYLVFATLMFPSLITGIIVMKSEITGGTEGLPGRLFEKFGRVVDTVAPASDPPFFNLTVEYYASLLIMLVSVTIMIIVAYSRIGLIFQSIRENQPAAEAAGINTTKYKVLAFVLSAFFAGLVGAFTVHSFASGYTIGNPYIVLGVGVTFNAMLYCIVGGVASIIGAVGGAYIMVFLDEFLTRMGSYFPEIAEMKLVIFGIILAAIFFVLPDGIFRRLYYYIRYGF